MAIETGRERKERLKREKRKMKRENILFSAADMHIQTGMVYNSVGEYTYA